MLPAVSASAKRSPFGVEVVKTHRRHQIARFRDFLANHGQVVGIQRSIAAPDRSGNRLEDCGSSGARIGEHLLDQRQRRQLAAFFSVDHCQAVGLLGR